MGSLILIPPIITFAFLIWRGFNWTLLYWWIPLMIWVPVYIEYDAPGVPPLTFYLTGFLPFIVRREMWISAFHDRHWLDFWVYAFIGIISTCEYVTTGFNAGRQMMLLSSLTFLGPYLAVKYTVLHARTGDAMARVFVWNLAFVALYSVWTFRMGVNHFLVLLQHWPYYYETTGHIVVIPRWGFFRAMGPFVHPISAGIAFGFVLPMAFWQFYDKKLNPPIKGLALLALCAFGLFMTMSRGPYLGGMIAIGLFLIGQSKDRLRLFGLVGLISIFMSVPLTLKISDYLSLTRETAKSDTQETALYRKDLIDNYLQVIAEKPITGYGFLNVPYVGDQNSIDNAYILFALNWGYFSVLAFLVLGVGTLVCLFRLGFQDKIDEHNRGACWMLMGGIAGCMFSMTTVFLARPISTMFFMCCGWSTALFLHWRRGTMRDSEEGVTEEEQVIEEEERPRMRIL